MRELNILTWHVHGNYLYYLSSVRHKIYLPVKPDRTEGYGGRCGTLRWPENLIEVPAEEVRNLKLDCILFQSRRNYEIDQYEILSEEQQQLPKVFLEHDPPREHPTDTKHIVDDDEVLLVQVTHFNNLMWDCGQTPTTVIEHGVTVPENCRYRGTKDRGIVVVNGLERRGRRLGLDLYREATRSVALDLIGIESSSLGGRGEVPYHDLPDFEADYRFFFNPIRYTSLGLAVCEAMMLGMPVVGMATTEMVSVIENGKTGYLGTNLKRVIDAMHELIENPGLARGLGRNARKMALERFGIDRFRREWERTFAEVTGTTLRQMSAINEGFLAREQPLL